jgi:hypothetical protein
MNRQSRNKLFLLSLLLIASFVIVACGDKSPVEESAAPDTYANAVDEAPVPTIAPTLVPTDPPPPTPTPSGGGSGQIAFWSDRTVEEQIFTIN